MTRPRGIFFGAQVGLLLAGACADRKTGECRIDHDCDTGGACIAEICLPLVGTSGRTLAVQVTPPSASAFLASEQAALLFNAVTQPFIRLDDRATVVFGVSSDPMDTEGATSARSQATLVLTMPSTILGRPDLQFEGIAFAREAKSPLTADLPIPERLLNSTRATLRVFPVAPLDQVLPPSEFLLPQLRSVLDQLKLPGPADLLFIDGVLETADGQPAENFVARAYRKGQLASNLSSTEKGGRFKLRISRSQGGPDPLENLEVDLVPRDPQAALPRLTIKRLEAGKLNLGTLRLPPRTLPETFVVPVVARQAGGTREERVAGAKLRFQTTILGARGAEAQFVREVQTGADGTAMVTLIPGEGTANRSYAVRIIPPERSDWSVRCVSNYEISPGTTGAVRTAASIALSGKLAITGVVRTHDGQPAGALRIRATRIGTTFPEDCRADTALPPTEVTTNRNGAYTLLLEPGPYRIDHEAPPGAAYPGWVEELVNVAASQPRDVNLPRGVVIEGKVVEPGGGRGVANAVVRLFEVSSPERILPRGEGLSNSEGRVRIVVP